MYAVIRPTTPLKTSLSRGFVNGAERRSVGGTLPFRRTGFGDFVQGDSLNWGGDISPWQSTALVIGRARVRFLSGAAGELSSLDFFADSSPRAHLHVVGMLWFLFLT